MHKIISGFEIQHSKAVCDAITKAYTPTERTVKMFNGYLVKVHTLEKALNRAMEALHDIRNILACPPDMDYAECASRVAQEAIIEVKLKMGEADDRFITNTTID